MMPELETVNYWALDSSTNMGLTDTLTPCCIWNYASIGLSLRTLRIVEFGIKSPSEYMALVRPLEKELQCVGKRYRRR